MMQKQWMQRLPAQAGSRFMFAGWEEHDGNGVTIRAAAILCMRLGDMPSGARTTAGKPYKMRGLDAVENHLEKLKYVRCAKYGFVRGEN